MAKSFKVHQLTVRQATGEEDRKGADAFLNDIGIGHRHRGIRFSKYREISIRRVEGYRAEYDKIMADESLADLQIHEFDDVYIVCPTEAIKVALEAGKGRNGSWNRDMDGKRDGTYPVYISIDDISPYIQINKPLEHNNQDNDNPIRRRELTSLLPPPQKAR